MVALVHIPTHMQHATNGVVSIEIPGEKLGQVIDLLIQQNPNLGEEILINGSIRSDIAIAIDSEITENGLLEKVGENSQIFFIPALGGGAR
ncbi:MAG: MoaD/ThiS family protein [Dehalococcoidia bacterium]|nr:MoaD/ThiS family protein [Dehalococcoidia bacterium]